MSPAPSPPTSLLPQTDGTQTGGTVWRGQSQSHLASEAPPFPPGAYLATVLAGGQADTERRYVMKKLHCRDAGFDCEGVIEADSTDEVLGLAGQHVKEVHGVDVTPEMAEAISQQIHDA